MKKKTRTTLSARLRYRLPSISHDETHRSGSRPSIESLCIVRISAERCVRLGVVHIHHKAVSRRAIDARSYGVTRS